MKKTNKIKNKDIMKSLRSNSVEAIPSAEFKKELESKLLKGHKSFLEQVIKAFNKNRTVYLSSFMTFTILLGATWMFLAKDNNILKTVVDDNGMYVNDSPYLSQHSIDPNVVIDMSEYKDIDGSDESLLRKIFSGESKDMVAFEDSSDVLSVMPSASLDSYSDYYEQPIIEDNNPLSGGLVNDNKDFMEFLQYLKDQEFEKKDKELFTERYLIKVSDKDENMAAFTELNIVDDNENIYKLYTYSNGEVYFYPKAYQYNTEQQINNKYNVVINSEIYTFTTEEDIWAIKLADYTPLSNEITLDLVFTIDTTGSMSDQINKLKETIGSISDDIHTKYPNVTIRYGLVAYRDISDDYLTKVYDFTTDLQEYQKHLDALRAVGGGDYKEDMNSALKDTIEELDWFTNKNDVNGNSLKLVFLIADAPPHMDYKQQYTYETAMFRSLELGIKIFPIASSDLDNSDGELVLRKIAAVTNAEYLFITNSNGGTEYHVGEDQFQVSNLDGLVIDVISKEIKGEN